METTKQKQIEYSHLRENNHLAWIAASDRNLELELARINSAMQDEILKTIESWAVRYAEKNSITVSAALKRATKADIEKLLRKEQNLRKTKDISDTAKKELDTLRFTMEISRQELLLRNLDLDMAQHTIDSENKVRRYLMDMVESELVRQSGILAFTLPSSADMKNKIKTIANASFHTTTFSERIWQHQNELRKKLEVGVSKSLLLGQNPTKWAKDLQPFVQETVYNSNYAMRRIALTESTRVRTDAQAFAYEANGYTHFGYSAEPTACPICQALNKKIFKVEDMQKGINAPPMHPNCRCSTFARFTDDIEPPPTPTVEPAPIKVPTEKPEGTDAALSEYIAGGYMSLKDALTDEQFAWVLNNRKMTPQGTFYRLEEGEFTKQSKQLKSGIVFEFDENLRSFTKSKTSLEMMIEQAEDWGGFEDGVIFRIPNQKVLGFDMEPYAKFYAEQMGDQQEIMIGSKFVVQNVKKSTVAGQSFTIIDIVQLPEKTVVMSPVPDSPMKRKK